MLVGRECMCALPSSRANLGGVCGVPLSNAALALFDIQSIYIYIHTYIYIYAYTHIYVCIYEYTYIFMYIHIYIYTHLSIFLYVYLYIYVRMRGSAVSIAAPNESLIHTHPYLVEKKLCCGCCSFLVLLTLLICILYQHS